MGIFDKKYIPMLGFATYTINITPKKVDPQGRIRTPEEIKNGTFKFVHTVYMDTSANIYIIPMKQDEDGEWVDCFSPHHIIEAANGDVVAKKVIEDCRSELINLYKKDLLSDSFLQRLYEQEKDDILKVINRNREEEGQYTINYPLPSSPKTVNNFTSAELIDLLITARSC